MARRPQSLTPHERTLRARGAAYMSWANTDDPAARTAPGRAAALGRFEHQVDPDRRLDPADRRRRATAALKAHMTLCALKSAKARRQEGEKDTAVDLDDETKGAV